MSLDHLAVDTLQHATGWITGQRWYGDKARRLTGVRTERVISVDVDSHSVILAIVRFGYENGDDARYFVPISAPDITPDTDQTPDFRDAVVDSDFLTWFLQGFAESRNLNGDFHVSWFPLLDNLLPVDVVDTRKARLISSEQSNSTVIFGRQLIGKFFRRLQSGINPDVEIGTFLTTVARFSHTPRMYGLMEATIDGEPYALAALQEFVPNDGDGWTWMLDQLRQLNADKVDDLVAEVRLLGQRTGDMHAALASHHDVDDFAPEPFDQEDRESLVQRVIAEMESSVEAMTHVLSTDKLEQLHKGLGLVMGDADALLGTMKIRVHGDYHLGQTLRTSSSDFAIIDFEGEPARTIPQRRAKYPALKDVAGMVRSLDYAVAMVRDEVVEEEQRSLLNDWLAMATDAYVTAYRDAVGEAATQLVPSDGVAFQHALNLMIAEKVLYEVRYELNNRPDWVHIPLSALLAIAGVNDVNLSH